MRELVNHSDQIRVRCVRQAPNSKVSRMPNPRAPIETGLVGAQKPSNCKQTERWRAAWSCWLLVKHAASAIASHNEYSRIGCDSSVARSRPITIASRALTSSCRAVMV